MAPAGSFLKQEMRPAVHDFRRLVFPLFAAQRTHHVDGASRETICSGQHVVAALLAADHARLGEGQSAHGD